MSDKGAIPDRGLSGFGLIETLLWTRSAGFCLLDLHRARLGASARRLGFSFDPAAVDAALAAAVEGFAQGAATPPESLRVRLVLQPDGVLEVGAVAIEPVPPQTVWRVAVAKARFDSGQPLLRHKTTRREVYESELAASGADEVLFLNERDEVCEGARANVFLERSGKLLTPPLSSGLLPGTLRADLLREGRAEEAILRLSDFAGADFFMGNSVRGLVKARLG
jgi:4-amino-4-deoxychorismate lyase